MSCVVEEGDDDAPALISAEELYEQERAAEDSDNDEEGVALVNADVVDSVASRAANFSRRELTGAERAVRALALTGGTTQSDLRAMSLALTSED